MPTLKYFFSQKRDNYLKSLASQALLLLSGSLEEKIHNYDKAAGRHLDFQMYYNNDNHERSIIQNTERRLHNTGNYDSVGKVAN